MRHFPFLRSATARTAAAVALLASLMLPTIASNSPASAGASCNGTGLPVRHLVRPANATSLYTTSSSEAASATGYGFTDDRGVAFLAEPPGAAGATILHRAYQATTGNFVWMPAGQELNQAVELYGYADHGPFLSVSDSASGCHVPVNRFTNGTTHRFAATDAERAALAAQGWTDEGVRFYARPADGATTPPPTTRPTTTPPTTPPTTQPPAEPPTASTAGSAPVGTTQYPVPAGALIVSPSGSDSNAGTVQQPVRTLARAVQLASNGSTIVLRAGTYRENVAIYKRVTIQSAPGETVWLDGSAPVTGWTRTSRGWRHDNWTTRFDSSPTYTQGAPDNNTEFYRFLNPAFPMAAHPDQVWIGGAPQQQVGSLSQLTAGTFYVDEARSQLHVGSNPSTSQVRASVLPKALSVRASGVVIRGIGIRRYAPSVWMVAGVTLESPSATVENVVIDDFATTGISALRADTVMRNLTVTDSGMLGIHVRNADRLQLTSVLVTGSNAEKFNITPSAGGIKVGQTARITVHDSDFSDNLATGFWTDWSVSDVRIANSTFNRNSGDGLFLELTARARVIGSFFADNDRFGIKVNNTSDVQIWNNAFSGNDRPLNLVQDFRRNDDRNDSAVDPRRGWPDPAMPWTLGPVRAYNNVIDGTDSTADCLICVEDYSREMSAEQMGITLNSNVYNRIAQNQPSRFVIWSRADVNPNPLLFGSLSAFTSSTGQERLGVQLVGPSVLNGSGVATNAVTALAAQKATPLTSEMANLAGRSQGERHLGLWP